MEKIEFLEQHIFTGLKNQNDGFDDEANQYFSESDFEALLERAEHFGIGVYKIEARLKGEPHAIVGHEDHRKKATDPRWYKKALLTLKTKQPGLSYTATYKVSNKLLAR